MIKVGSRVIRNKDSKIFWSTRRGVSDYFTMQGTVIKMENIIDVFKDSIRTTTVKWDDNDTYKYDTDSDQVLEISDPNNILKEIL